MLRLSLRRRRQLLPWLFLGPGLLWLIVFFAIPLINQLNVSLQSGDAETGYAFTWNFSVYTDAISDYSTQFLRSIGYSATATVLCLIIGFPLAYFTAFKAGRFKNLILLLIILPFFVSYVLRTVAWQLILSDNGWVAERMRDVDLLSEDGRLLASRTAVIAGITYNFLPFMILPLYVSLEKIDRRLIEAATDLYASRTTAFRKVTLRRLAADLHPGMRRLHQRRAAGHSAPVHDRQRDPVEVHHDPRLPDRGRAVVHPHELHPRRGLPVRARSRHPEPDRGGVLDAIDA
jgi:spermidine/putrescine transport system permease protein